LAVTTQCKTQNTQKKQLSARRGTIRAAALLVPVMGAQHGAGVIPRISMLVLQPPCQGQHADKQKKKPTTTAAWRAHAKAGSM